MNIKLFFTVCGTVFLAELADKTQIATVLFAANGRYDRITVFLGAAVALIAASALAVFVGGLFSHLAGERWIARCAGLIFIIIGLWTVVRA